jgi:tyrosine-protein kinase Src
MCVLFTENAVGLCHVLARPCPKPKPQVWDLSPDLRDQWEIDRSEVQLLRKLGHGNFGEVWYGKYCQRKKIFPIFRLIL